MDRIEFEYEGNLIEIRRSEKNLFSIVSNRCFAGYMFTSAKEITFNHECELSDALRKIIIKKLN